MKTILIQKNVDAEIRNKLYMKLSLFLIHFKDLRTVFAKHISVVRKKFKWKYILFSQKINLQINLKNLS